MSRTRDPRQRLAAVLTLAVAAVAFPMGSLASDYFLDVPDSNIFHSDISALADSGVTTGCGGGNYCPSAFVTREQMAAFMNRLGALGPGKLPVVNAAELNGFTSDQFVRSDAEHNGYASCSGANMFPDNSTDEWASSSYLKYPTVASGIEFSCVLDLPNGATVTFFQATLRDASGTEEIGSCLLHAHLLSTDSGSAMASIGASGVAFSTGNFTAGSGSITNPVVDRSLYSYIAGCVVNGSGDDVGVIGIQVSYTYSIGG